MLEKAFKRIHAYPVKKRKALQCYTITYFWHAVKKGESALTNVALKQGTFKPFLVIVGSCRGDIRYYEDFMKFIYDPNSPTVYSLILQEYRIVVVIVVLLVETKIISIKPNTQLFSKCNLSKCDGDEETLDIAERVKNFSSQRVQEIGRRFDVVLPLGSIYSVLSTLLEKHMRLPIKIQADKDVFMYMRKWLDTMAVHMLVESEEVPDLSIPDSYSQMSSPINSDEWSVSGASSLVSNEISRLCSRRNEYLESNPNPPRKSDHAITIPQICGIFNATDEPTDENMLANGAAATRQNAQEAGAAVAAAGANMNAAELEEGEGDQLQGAGDIYEGENVNDNYEFMNFAPNNVDLPVLTEAPAQPSNEPLAGPNQGQNPVRRPTSGCPPNAERAGATNAGIANSEHDVPEAPTARKHGAAVAQVEPFRTSALKRSSILSSEGSDIEVVSVAQVERPDAKTAESKRKRAHKRQRVGPQATARGVGPHVRRTASQDPQPCAPCGAARIGDSEGSDIADDSSVLFDDTVKDMVKDMCRDMCREYVRREYMHWQRNKACRGPHMR